jgi:hypothetical protein
MPDVNFEDLGLEISRHNADVVHISSHGNERVLSFGSAAGIVQVTGDMLSSFLNVDRVPSVVYINSCDSAALAEKLTAVVPIVIGVTAPITNLAARSAAVLFYDRILQGRSIASAFDASRNVIEGLHDKRVSAKLWTRDDVNPRERRMHSVPQIIARFDGAVKKNGGGYDLEIGLVGCPQNTRTVIFFTNNEGFLREQHRKEGHPEKSLVSVVLNPGYGAEIWAEQGWWTDVNFKLWACGVTADDQFIVSSTICDAIEQWYKISLYDSNLSSVPSNIRDALAALRGALVSKPKTLRRKSSIGSVSRRGG